MNKPLTWAVAVVLAVATMLSLLALAQGLCCYDDASFAVVSRSVAEGRGYSITLNYSGEDFSRRAFPADIGTGPASILPVALAIRLFGAESWVPGITHVMLAALLLAGFAHLLSRVEESWRLPAYVALFWLLVVALSTRWLSLWAAQLGEPIAAMLVVCGYAAWAFLGSRRLAALLAGLCVGLAVLTKEMAGLAVIAFLAVAGGARAAALRAKPFTAEDALRVSLLAAAGLVPFVAFEFWRLSALGPVGWIDNWQEHFMAIRRQSASVRQLVDWWSLLATRAGTVSEHFFALPSLLIALAAASLALVWRYGPGRTRLFALLLACGTAVHVAYWVWLSIGWPRYLYIGIVLWSAMAALPLLAKPPRMVMAAYLAALAVLPISSLDDLKVVRPMWQVVSGSAPDPNRADREVLAYLDRDATGETVYTVWWAHVANLEYLSKEPGRFQGGAYRVLDAGAGKTVVVVDTKLVDRFKAARDVKLLDRLREDCRLVMRNETYHVFRCGPA